MAESRLTRIIIYKSKLSESCNQKNETQNEESSEVCTEVDNSQTHAAEVLKKWQFSTVLGEFPKLLSYAGIVVCFL